MDEKASALTAAKMAAGFRAADMVQDDMVVGLGTGSTVFYTIERLAVRIREGLRISGIPTSYQTALRAREYGIPLTTLDDNPILDLAIDGADEVDPHLNLIKGRGAAHMREKCVASAAMQFIVVVDEQKVVPHLKAPVPVEVLPFAVLGHDPAPRIRLYSKDPGRGKKRRPGHLGQWEFYCRLFVQ